MMRNLVAALLAIFHVAVLTGTGQALAQSSTANVAPLKVATKPTPPFAMKGTDGVWTGLAVDLMQEVGARLGRKVVWTELTTTHELLEAARKGDVDASIAAITVTAEREKVIDFTHGYYDSGLAIAVRKNSGGGFWAGLYALTSPAFLGTVSMLVGLLLATGALVWFIEKRANPGQFEHDLVKGIGSGFWWAAVTMTTVGYGDKAPVTPAGRLVAVIWMFAALILTAVFTAQLTSALTVNRLEGAVSGFGDLSRNRVGIVERTASVEYFRSRGIATIPYPSVAAGLKALEAGRIQAFVHDEPIIRYDVVRNHTGKLELLPDLFDAQSYGIALPSGSPLREPLNQALLAVLASSRWPSLKARYLGRSKGGY